MNRDPVTDAEKQYEVIFTFEREHLGSKPPRYVVSEEQATWVRQVLTSRPDDLASSVEIEAEIQRFPGERHEAKTIVVRPALVGALIPL